MPLNANVKDYLKPENLEEACDFLRENEDAMPVAGGTGISIFMNKGLMSNVRSLVDLDGLGLSFSKKNNDSLEIGSMTKLADMIQFTRDLNIARTALLSIPKEIRNLGTLGGQVFTAYPAFDMSVCLLALGATVNIYDGSSNKSIALEELYSGMFQPNIPPGGIIKSVLIPLNKFNNTHYVKIGKTGHGFSDISFGLSADFRDGTINKIAIAIGGGSLESEPVRLSSVEERLNGMELTKDRIDEAFALVNESKSIEFRSDERTSADFRKHTLAVHIRRVLTDFQSRGGILK